MANNRKSLIPFEVSYSFTSFIPARGEVKNVEISGKTASWENGLITVTENKTSINPSIYSYLKDGNDRSQPLKKIYSSEYFPLATLTVTNKDAGDKLLHNIGGLGLDSLIQVSIKGQIIKFLPLKTARTSIGFGDFRDVNENDKNKDTVKFQNILGSYQELQIENPTTGRPERSPFYFGYVGAVEGKPKSITKDQLLVGNKNTANLDDGEMKTYTLYGRLFAVDIFDPIKIISISEDTGIKGDFRTNDNTLIFNGTAEAESKVEVFLDNKSIGIAYANDKGNWLHNYSQVKLPDGKYILTAAETNLFGEMKTTTQQQLEIDTDYDIDLDFSDPSVANNKPLQKQIQRAAEYWEGIILNDIPDVKDIAVGDPKRAGLIDDLKIKFIVKELLNEKGEKDGKENTLAVTNTIPKSAIPKGAKNPEYIRLRDPLTGQPQSANYLPYYTVIEIDSADISDIIRTDTNYGLQTLEHEIAHAIGFNSETFDKKGLIEKNIGNYRYGFKGKNALAAYHALGGKVAHKSVPLEDDKGLTPSHWNEWLFPDSTEDPFLFGTDELMTTSPPPGEEDVFLSKLTLGAFQDLGFNVDPNKGTNNQVDQGSWLYLYTNPILNIGY
jgi:Bacterial Ig-like domain/Leishmanolysin